MDVPSNFRFQTYVVAKQTFGVCQWKYSRDRVVVVAVLAINANYLLLARRT